MQHQTRLSDSLSDSAEILCEEARFRTFDISLPYVTVLAMRVHHTSGRSQTSPLVASIDNHFTRKAIFNNSDGQIFYVGPTQHPDFSCMAKSPNLLMASRLISLLCSR